MKQSGVAGTGITENEKVMEGVEDGRTENVILGYEEGSAEESWQEFLGRVKAVKEEWTSDCEGAGEESVE